MFTADPFNVKIDTIQIKPAGPGVRMIWFCRRCCAIRGLNNSTRAREGNSLFMVASTVGEFFAAKLRSSVQRGANPISRDT